MAAVWCPDWPVTVARLDSRTLDSGTLDSGTAGVGGVSPELPVAVFVGNRVLACSHSAREAGVRRGQRRREAQSRCPELLVLPRNEMAEARAFEPVVAALESIAPGVEITRPGLAAIGMRGPTRYFGGETGVLHALSRAVADLPAATCSGHHPARTAGTDGAAITAGTDVLIGVADGAFAAEQAARRGVVVEPGGSSAFLADLPIETLGLPDLAGLLRRLGLRTLGAFATLPARDVLARFGPSGAWAHRQAGGRDDRPVAGRRPPVEFAVELELEPPVDRVDTIAFSARGIAEQFITDLAAHGLACACLELQAVSANGEETARRWRHAGVLSTTDVLDRLRWQLEGWLSTGRRPTAGVARLRLVPIEVVPTGAHQQALWGGAGEADERAHRALARVQTLLGHGSVLTPVLDGGREPRQRSRLVPWGDEPAPTHSPQQPWPGRLPAPAPSVLLDPPRPAQVLDADSRPVVVTARGAVPNPPARFGLGSEQPVAIASWAGPWPVDERWWQPEAAQHVVRCQLVDVRGRAYLVSGTMSAGAAGPHWQVEAVYD
jgi:protein ImuB